MVLGRYLIVGYLDPFRGKLPEPSGGSALGYQRSSWLLARMLAAQRALFVETHRSLVQATETTFTAHGV